MRLHTTLMALVVLFSCAVLAQATDLAMVFSTSVDGKAGTATEYMTSNQLRMSEGSHDTIIDTKAGLITAIDHQKKEYSQMTVAELQAAMQGASKKMADMMTKQQEAMKNMPPEMRERMQKMMGGAGGPMSNIKVEPAAGTRKVAGYDTQLFVMTVGDSMKTQMWVTSAIKPPLEPGEMLRLQSMMNPMMKDMGNATAEFQKIRGVTLSTHSTFSMMGRTMESSRDAVEVKTTAIPASAFAIPAGYKRVESPMLQMGR